MSANECKNCGGPLREGEVEVHFQLAGCYHYQRAEIARLRVEVERLKKEVKSHDA